MLGFHERTTHRHVPKVLQISRHTYIHMHTYCRQPTMGGKTVGTKTRLKISLLYNKVHKSSSELKNHAQYYSNLHKGNLAGGFFAEEEHIKQGKNQVGCSRESKFNITPLRRQTETNNCKPVLSQADYFSCCRRARFPDVQQEIIFQVTSFYFFTSQNIVTTNISYLRYVCHVPHYFAMTLTSCQKKNLKQHLHNLLLKTDFVLFTLYRNAAWLVNKGSKQHMFLTHP